MQISFIHYEQINDRVIFGVHDPEKGFSRKEFTVSAMQELIEMDDNMSEHLKRIRNAIIDLGGMKWIRDNIIKWQRRALDGEVSVERETA